MRFRVFLVLSVVSSLLGGCLTTQGTSSDWCAMSGGPWRPTQKELAAMTDNSVARMLEHNRYGERHCGWTVPVKPKAAMTGYAQ